MSAVKDEVLQDNSIVHLSFRHRPYIVYECVYPWQLAFFVSVYT